MLDLYRMAACAGFAAMLVHVSYAKEWRGIVPLHSTRQDVARILGRSDSGDVYKLDDAIVLISYSSANCRQGGSWDVPRDTVQRITVSPRKPFPISELQLNLSKYETVVDGHVPSIAYYNNSEEGLHIQTYHNNVTSIDYLPAASDDHLRCGTIPFELISRTGQKIESHALFDSYGRLPFNQEKQHLDLFGRKLRDSIGAQGYIVFYSGRGATSKESQERANKARKYLSRNYQLKKSLEILKGNEREEFTIELYVVSRQNGKQD